jgi:hypothetical protein
VVVRQRPAELPGHVRNAQLSLLHHPLTFRPHTQHIAEAISPYWPELAGHHLQSSPDMHTHPLWDLACYSRTPQRPLPPLVRICLHICPLFLGTTCTGLRSSTWDMQHQSKGDQDTLDISRDLSPQMGRSAFVYAHENL